MDLQSPGSDAAAAPVKQGWLEKRAVSARLVKNYRRRLLVLWPDRVCWHQDSAQEAPAGELPLRQDSTVIALLEPTVLSVSSDGRTLVLRSSDAAELHQWYVAFQSLSGAIAVPSSPSPDAVSGAVAVPPSSPAAPAQGECMTSGGECMPGYERVRDLFLSGFAPGGPEDRAQLCAYVRGVKVVELWASRTATAERRWGYDCGCNAAERPYDGASLQNVWSSTKVLTSLVVAMLVDRGHLAYEQRVAEVWPEFAAHGKADCTVAMLMRHEAGLAQFDRPLGMTQLTAQAIRAGAVSEVIAAQRPAHAPGARRVYHPLTRGWLVNELVRRADPAGRTVGQFLLEEVSTPLDLRDELRIGLPDEMHALVAPLVRRSGWWHAKQVFLGGGRIAGCTAG